MILTNKSRYAIYYNGKLLKSDLDVLQLQNKKIAQVIIGKIKDTQQKAILFYSDPIPTPPVPELPVPLA